MFDGFINDGFAVGCVVMLLIFLGLFIIWIDVFVFRKDEFHDPVFSFFCIIGGVCFILIAMYLVMLHFTSQSAIPLPRPEPWYFDAPVFYD